MNLSIIVNIKYLSKHLDDCIKSLLSQNLKDYEIILVSQKNNTSLDVFLLNILSKYTKYKNIRVIQEETDDLNLVLNRAIYEAKGKYISIIDQDTIVLGNTYYEFFKLQEEFQYDLFVFDYIKILKDINLAEVYNRYNRSIEKKNRKNRFKNKNSIKKLKESGLIFDFSKYSKNEYNNSNIKAKGFKYYTSNIFESIQRLELKYKYKILTNIDIQNFNFVIKSSLLKNNIYIFPFNLNTKLDILKVLPQIKSITCIKNTAICKYSYIDTSFVNYNNIKIDINELCDIVKNRYKQIIEKYKSNINTYLDALNLIEYYMFLEILNFESFKKYYFKYKIFNNIEYQKYIKEIYLFLQKEFPNYLNNKYLTKNIFYKIKIKNKIKKLKKYINKDLIKLETTNKEKTIKDKEKIIKEKKKASIKEKEKVRSKNKKLESIKQEKQQKKEKIKTNKLKVIIRKLSLDINRIRTTRINDTLKVILKQIKTIYLKIKIFLIKLFKREKVEVLKIEDKKLLLLDSGDKTIKKDEKSIIKNNKKNIKELRKESKKIK